MTKLPVISGRKAIKAFQKLGCKVTRKKGSHIQLHHPTNVAKASPQTRV